MNVALVSFGHVDVVLPLVKNLGLTGVNVELYLCFALNRKSESILDFNEKRITKGFLSKEKTDEILPEGVKKYLTNASSVNFFIFHNLKLRSFNNFLLAFSLVKRLKFYDIVHFNGINGVLPLLIFLLRKRRLVFTIHDVLCHSGEKTRFSLSEKLNRFIIKSKYPLVIQNISDHRYIINKYHRTIGKIYFIPFGVLDIYREFGIVSKDTQSSDLLFFGRISPYKGVEYLLDAIRSLNSRGILLNTIIAGEGDFCFEKDDFEKLGVKLINRYIPNEELVALIEGTKVIICPYTDATQSGVLMTAFAFNKPVIASNTGSFQEVIKDGINGFLVPPKDANKLALKIERLISDSALLKEMQTNINNIAISGGYSWSYIADRMLELYTAESTNG